MFPIIPNLWFTHLKGTTILEKIKAVKDIVMCHIVIIKSKSCQLIPVNVKWNIMVFFNRFRSLGISSRRTRYNIQHHQTEDIKTFTRIQTKQTPWTSNCSLMEKTAYKSCLIVKKRFIGSVKTMKTRNLHHRRRKRCHSTTYTVWLTGDLCAVYS